MGPALLDGIVGAAAAGSDVLIIEGVMGLFDGIGLEPGRTGATADLAARYGMPVLLVLDVAGQSQSAAALVRGFASHRAGVHIAGVVLNKVGSDRHRRLVADAIADLQIPIVGVVPRDAGLAFPERHLGLVQAGEHGDLDARLDALADMAERCLDLDAILALASPPRVGSSAAQAALPPPGTRIALAQDDAFTFLYPHVIQGWRQRWRGDRAVLAARRRGAARDLAMPVGFRAAIRSCMPDASPRRRNFKSGLAAFAATRPVHGECGGYMVLGEGLEDAEGVRHAMTGLLGHATSFAQRKLHLGYRQARLLSDCALGHEGDSVRGHEFHYAISRRDGE